MNGCTVPGMASGTASGDALPVHGLLTATATRPPGFMDHRRVMQVED